MLCWAGSPWGPPSGGLGGSLAVLALAGGGTRTALVLFGARASRHRVPLLLEHSFRHLFRHSSVARAKFAAGVRGSKRKRRAWRCAALSLACCCVRCGPFRCARACVLGCCAALLPGVAGLWHVWVCGSLQHSVALRLPFCAMLGIVWLVWCLACVHDGLTMLAWITLRARTRERAEERLLGGVCGLLVLLLVLYAIVGIQHCNQHCCVLAAARAWPGRAAVDACAQDSRRHVAWQPGQRARAGRLGGLAHHASL